MSLIYFGEEIFDEICSNEIKNAAARIYEIQLSLLANRLRWHATCVAEWNENYRIGMREVKDLRLNVN